MAKKFPQLSSILKTLLFQKDMKPVDLARELNIPQPTIHRIVTGKSSRPYRSSLEPIAKYFSLNVGQLLGEEPLPSEIATNKKINTVKYLSLLPWEELHAKSNFQHDSEEKIPFIGTISNDGFATFMSDSSMEPVFSRNSLLIFDPHRTPKDRSYVLVQLHGTKLTVFRQLLIDLDHKYLKPLNPDLNTFKMRLLEENDKIYAVLVEARRAYDDL